MLDINTIRENTPGVENVVHLNNAGASLMPRIVLDSMKEYFDYELLNGGYETEAFFYKELQKFYDEAAVFLNAKPEEIAFTDSATESWQRAFFALPWKDGDEIITGNAEYASNYISFLRLQNNFKVKIKIAADNDSGETDPESIRQLLTEKTKLIAITHMPTAGGLVNPIEEIGQIASAHPALYLVDACQSVGQYPLDVHKIKCDILTGTGRKYLRGPRGTGLLFIRKEIMFELEPMSIDLFSANWSGENEYSIREDAKKFETYEKNFGALLGLKTALNYYNSLNKTDVWNRIQDLAQYLKEKLREFGITKIDNAGKIHSGLVSFDPEFMPALDLMKTLRAEKFNTSIGRVGNSRLYMKAIGMETILRASVHYYNTHEEIDLFIDKLRSIKNRPK